MEKAQPLKKTAGLRGAIWNAKRMAGRDNPRAVILPTEDGAATMGLLYAEGKERTVVMAQHPREFVVGHYMIPEVLDGGAAFFVQAPRTIGNDLRLEHEQSLYEVAAGVRFLRDAGFEKIILLGNSGGASLYAYYNEQSLLALENRLERSPTGRPTKYAAADMPPVDGIVLVSPHPGQGLLLLNGIDPSVTDETDAMSVDESLYPFHPKNGFRMPPGETKYSDDFVARYRSAQKERVARIDAWAKDVIADRMGAKNRLKEEKSVNDLVIAAHTPIRVVWRTDADLRCFDLTMDPSERGFGSLWGPNPLASNYGSIGFGRQVSAESWLSTWSGISSKAALPRTAPSIEQPTLLIAFKGDNSIFPEETASLFETVGASEKSFLSFSGNHHGRVGETRSGQEEAGAAIREWMSDCGFVS